MHEVSFLALGYGIDTGLKGVSFSACTCTNVVLYIYLPQCVSQPTHTDPLVLGLCCTLLARASYCRKTILRHAVVDFQLTYMS
jgi:hypothetical protein